MITPEDLLYLQTLAGKDGFIGIVELPSGQKGWASVLGNGKAISWFPIGLGQDPHEVLAAAKAVYDYMSQPTISLDSLFQLNEKAAELSRPLLTEGRIYIYRLNNGDAVTSCYKGFRNNRYVFDFWSIRAVQELRPDYQGATLRAGLTADEVNSHIQFTLSN